MAKLIIPGVDSAFIQIDSEDHQIITRGILDSEIVIDSEKLVEGNGILITETNGTATISVDTDIIADTEWVLSNVHRSDHFKINVDVGENLASAPGQFATALGPSTTATNNGALAVGNASNATGVRTVAIGDRANATDSDALAMGDNALADTEEAVSIGSNTVASGERSVALGAYVTASGTEAVAIGAAKGEDHSDRTIASGNNSLAIGAGAEASGSDAIAIGEDAEATQQDAIAIGDGTNAQHFQSIAIGNGATTDTDNQLVIDAIQHVKTPDFTPVNLSVNYITVDADGNWEFAEGSGESDFFKFNPTDTDSEAQATGLEAIAIGNDTLASGHRAIAIGSGAEATGDNIIPNDGFYDPIAIGHNALASGALGSVALGYDAQATQSSSFALGSLSRSTGLAGIALGYDAKATDDYSLAIGVETNVTHAHAIGLGNGAVSSADSEFSVYNINSIRTPSFTGGANKFIAVDSNGEWSIETGSGGGSNAIGILFDTDLVSDKAVITLDEDVDSDINLSVFVNGVFFDEDEYSRSNRVITFNETLYTGDNITVLDALAVTQGGTGLLNILLDTDLTSDKTVLTLDKSIDNDTVLSVFVNGVFFDTDGYSHSGNEITFVNTLYTGDQITVLDATGTGGGSGGSDLTAGYGIDIVSDAINVDTDVIADVDYVKDQFGYQNLFTDVTELQRYPTTHDIGHEHFASNGSDVRWYYSQETVFNENLSVGATLKVNFVSANQLETPNQEGYYSVFSLSNNQLDQLFSLNLEHIEGDDPLNDRGNVLDTENHYTFEFSYENRAAGRTFDGNRSGYVAQPEHRRDYEFLNGHGTFEEPKPWLKSEDETAAIASGNNSVAVGGGAIASAANSTAVGYGAQISNSAHNNSIVLGAGPAGDSEQLTINGVDKVYTPDFNDTTDKVIQVGSDGHWSLVDNVVAGGVYLDTELSTAKSIILFDTDINNDSVAAVFVNGVLFDSELYSVIVDRVAFTETLYPNDTVVVRDALSVGPRGPRGPSANEGAALQLPTATADPSGQENGAMVYRSDIHRIRALVNGTWVSLVTE